MSPPLQHLAATPAGPSAGPTLPCPCGRDHPLAECCLPVAQRLRRGAGGRPSPFDEIRATSALLLWGLLSREAPDSPVRAALSAAARRFWCSALSGGPGDATTPVADADSPWRTPDLSGSDPDPEQPLLDPEESAYGRGLFERIWCSADAETLTWLLGALPAFIRDDPVLGEIAIDWVLWDEPWLKQRPGGHWTAQSTGLSSRPRVRRTYEAILRSRIGLWRLEEHLPGRGFRLADRLTGDRTLLTTNSDPWPDSDERLLLARIYSFGPWRLIAGRSLLLLPEAVDCLLVDLNARAVATSAPPPSDPQWKAWLGPQLIPLIARQWVARLAPPPPDRYHGTYC